MPPALCSCLRLAPLLPLAAALLPLFSRARSLLRATPPPITLLSSLLSALLAAGSPGPEALGTHNGTGEKPDFQVGGHCHALEVIGTALSKQIGVF